MRKSVQHMAMVPNRTPKLTRAPAFLAAASELEASEEGLSAATLVAERLSQQRRPATIKGGRKATTNMPTMIPADMRDAVNWARRRADTRGASVDEVGSVHPRGDEVHRALV